MKWNNEQKTEIHRLWNLDYTIEEIANSLGRTFHSVRGYIERHRSSFAARDNSNTEILNALAVRKRNLFRDEIEEPPKMIPVPEGALHLPWIELTAKQCQWGLSNDFFEPASNHYVCCGLEVVKHRCCEYHLKFRKKGWDEN